MNHDKNIISYLMLIAACLLLYAGYSTLNQIPSRPKTKSTAAELPLLKSNNSELIERALSYKTPDSCFTYTGDFQNPFRSFNQKQTKSTARTSLPPPPQRAQLYLKGILIKEKPLAILEDLSGETYIRSIGESVLDQKIISISGNLVKLRDLRGTYELSVEGE